MNEIKTLLLNDNYQILAVLNDRRAIKLLLNNKADVISVWNGRKICYVNGYIEHPATLRMKYHIKLNSTKLNFSKNLILRRDKYICAYCQQKYNPSDLTIDHIIPKSCGGSNSFINCVAACEQCNKKKSNKTPQEANMILYTVPTIPSEYLCLVPKEIIWHDDWVFFI